MTYVSANEEPAVPQRALVIAAHPDDIEYLAGGTVAKWVRAGSVVRYVMVTNGDAGVHVPGITREKAACIREAEQRSAAQVLGVERVVFLGYHDGEVEPTLKLRRELVREIRLFKPDIVICFDPTHLYFPTFVNHPDHRAAGQAALDAVTPLPFTPKAFEGSEELRGEALEPHHVNEVLVMYSADPNTWIDISDTIDLKIESLQQHASQFSDGQKADRIIREMGATSGAEVGIPYAEPFRRIVMVPRDKS